MANEKRLISVDVVLTGIATFKECYEGAGLKPWIVEHIHTALQMVERFVKESPTVDAVEVVHGRWEKKTEQYVYYYACSVCGEPVLKNSWGYDFFSNYCPNCGAKMRGSEE